MVKSDTYKYIFIEVPRTGTSAITKELCKFYDGHKILRKHSSYWNLLVNMKSEWKDYHIFSGIRNPMDSIVSLWFKLKNKQKDPYKKSPSLNMAVADEYFKRHYRFANLENKVFSDYFLKFYKRPYNDMTVSHGKFDYVIRFENLQDDFDRWLSLMNIDKERDLPIVNTTQQRSRDFWNYYEERTWKRAFRVFGPYFDRWNYNFPENWGRSNNSNLNKFIWNISNPMIKLSYFLFYLGNDNPE